ncbi:MAG: amino acid adenylation domain-containing protein [Candidatus Aminicenantes bacterium]|nr:amino acid adenylation domain-containing protein [Candidatus Aminicenantes bacterium]NIM82563.1 amino acid adenylation domain-containing protein [Candidatus Aminicenantes bacterium]NIN21923.1 amino acid adenylation domain-containing protein [Candidatus Aminicenantes bacterium]NIN45701.1 amino acid adenylation domain-containing protein [Candidatus Aminicenantes bacterium]NIN88536.1 amino acid adenylation domain-containing protein [Candidatus Aminicenantes bacterium]
MKVRASYHQERLWFIHQFEYEDLYEFGPRYHNIPLILEIKGALDPHLLEQGLNTVINRHEALRTSMITVENQLFQLVEPGIDITLQVLDLADGSSGLDMALEEARRPFFLEGQPLIRAVLIKVSTVKHFLVITLHHLVSDRCSLGIIAAELARCYQALQEGLSPVLPDVPLHYADFSQWQRELPRDFLESLFFYWRRQLTHLTPLELPTRIRRSAIHTFQEGRVSFQLPVRLSTKIKEFCREKSTGNDVLLLAAFKVLLHRYCGQEDITLGTCVDNRHLPGTKSLVGPAANLLVLRTTITGQMSFNTILPNIIHTVEQAHKHQDIPFDRLALELNPQKDMSRTVFFDVLFQYREKPFQVPPVRGLEIKYIETNLGWGKYDLNLFIQGGEECFPGVLVYNNDYYDDSFASCFIQHYKVLLESIFQAPDQPISHLAILTNDERHRLLVQWNRTRAHYPEDKTIHGLFEEQVQRTPDSAAVVGKGAAPPANKGKRTEEPVQLIYRELNRSSDQLAQVLKEKGVLPDNIVGIMVERSLEMIIGILGILKAGGAYLPIDPDYPEERINYMLKDSNAKILLAAPAAKVKVEVKVKEKPIELIYISNQLSSSTSTLTLTCEVSSANLAYVIYTSGTTGRPKGCLVTHQNLVRLLINDQLPFQFNENDIWVMGHSFCFDFSVWEMYGALLKGGRLVIPAKEIVRDINMFLAFIKKHSITVLNQTPQAFYALAEVEAKSPEHSLNSHLRYVIFGGDKLLPQKLSAWLDRYSPDEIQLVNMYGITETTVHVTYYRLKESDIRSPQGMSPIGRPIPETTLYILDSVLNPMPVGVTGEIFVGGTGVIRGYLNRVRLTRQRFFPIPHFPGEIIYKSGDLGRRLTDGSVEYLSRSDDQVQIRGYRIEPAEIESHILTHPAVKETVVVTREDKDHFPVLCAYLRLRPGRSLPDMRNYLIQKLPQYMIPAYFVPVNAIPLTPNKKVDKKALPDPQTGKDKQKRIPPRGPVEKTLAAIWADVLEMKTENIGINDDFFDLGGHSLKATALIAKVHEQLQVKLPLVELFKTPKIRELAKYITAGTREEYSSIEPGEEKEYYPLSPAQRRLYILQQLVPGSTGYNIPYVIPVDPGQEMDREKLEAAFRKLLDRHETLRTSFEMVRDEPLQRVHEELDFSLGCYETARTEEVETVMVNFTRPFDLSKPPLLRVELVNIGTSRQVLFIDMHHIITDAASQRILEKEFMVLYSGSGKELPPLRFQYKDYSEWQNSREQAERVKEQKKYWINEFSDEFPVLNLPTDYPRPLMQGFEGNWVNFALTGEETKIIKDIARANDVTLYMCLLAVFNILYSKLSGQEDIIVGTPAAARRHADLQHIIGMIVNTLVMRNYPRANKTFKEFLNEVKQRTLEAYENQEYPFEELVEEIAINRDTSRNPLFDVMFNLMDTSNDFSQIDNTGIKELTSHSYKHRKRTSRFDLVFSALDLGEHIYFAVEYSTRLFAPHTIDRFINYLRNIVRHLPGNTGSKLSDISLIPGEEKQEILEISRGSEEIVDTDRTIHQWFQEQVEQTPDRVCCSMLYPIGSNVSITYKELNQRSNQLAHILREKSVGPGSVVGLMMERSIEMIMGILGILKAGGVYLPIDPGYPQQRIQTMLDDSGACLLLTQQNVLAPFSITSLKNMKPFDENLVVTRAQIQITDFDRLPIPDRTLIDYRKYHQYIGEAPAKHTITLQGTRGCPYSCLYCHKIWPKKHVTRSAGNIFKEISYAFAAGIRRFVFIDDIFNLDRKNAVELMELIIKSSMDIQLFFPNGFRGDILDRDFIDLMVQAGTVNLDVALESASPRIQKLIRKNLDLEKFKENVQYITETYPQVILEMEMMHGFPTETEEEAMITLDFLKTLRWVHFPNLHLLKIFPNTDMCKLAIETGIPGELIERSANLAFHELPDTLPFPKHFTRQFQAKFMGEYFFAQERLVHVLPYQMKILTEDELVQKYDSYLSSEVNCFEDILQYAGISREELGNGDVKLMQEDQYMAPDFCGNISQYFPVKTPPKEAFRILLLDLSQLFTQEHEHMLHHQIEEPLGLLYLMTYLNETFKERINGKVYKSRIDFDSYAELKQIIADFKPDMIGIRTLSFYKDFFHKAVLMIRQWGVSVPIIAGGPYATSDYKLILQDPNVDIVVLGEGELTLGQLVEKMIENNRKLPGENILQEIRGIAFVSDKTKLPANQRTREILLLDEIPGRLNQYPPENPEQINRADDLLYVIYTSGSTGRPKGVMLEHGNLVNLIRYQYNHTGIDFSRVLQFTTITFDVSAQEIFSTLLAGGQLFLVSRDTLTDVPALFKQVKNHHIKTLFLPTSFLKFVMNEEDFLQLVPASVNHIVTAGEQVVINERFKRYLPENKVYLHNHYGPSETHVVTAFTMNPTDYIPELPPIGRPVSNTVVYILDKGMNPVPIRVPGELFIGGIQVGRGYLNNPELTAEKFILAHSSWLIADRREKKASSSGELPMSYELSAMSCLYRTGDLARWLPDGNIEFLGRVDYQVKIRGFRVELGEIESRLLNHNQIKECVVLAIPGEKGSKNLCAYIAAGSELSSSQVREYLSGELPDYMIPSFFVFLDKIPVTPNRKVDRRALPAPEVKAGEDSSAPRSETQKKLAAIWSEILNINNIGIDDNFFELGGHSLLATILAAKIHKEFQVKLALVEVFKTPTIRGLSPYIQDAVKEKHTSIEPVEKKDYYVLSSAQQRLYLIQQMDLKNTAYNMPEIIPVGEDIDIQKLEETFNKLIQRHESLRTSFHMIANEPVQKIHDAVEFEIEQHTPAFGHPSQEGDRAFVRPFDLANAPLLRVGLTPHQVLLVDMHHIISDGISRGVLMQDFTASYRGEALPPLRIQYKDFAGWQNRRAETDAIKQQADFWLKEFREEVPVLNLPFDFHRPGVHTFSGSVVNFEISHSHTTSLKAAALDNHSTLYMVLLSIFYILLFKLSSQEDIVIGTPVAGRGHIELENIIGMFVNTLALRHFSNGEKSFSEFLKEVKEHTLKAFENQDYPFEELVEKAAVQRDVSRNPIFDVMFVFQNTPDGRGEVVETPVNIDGKKEYNYIDNPSKFDLTLFTVESGKKLALAFQYATKLFKPGTIEKFARYFCTIVTAVVKNPGQKLFQIDLLSEEEKQQLLVDFNDTGLPYPNDKTLPQLFARQAARTPDGIALIGTKAGKAAHVTYTYRLLDQESNQLAHYLLQQGAVQNEPVGLLLDRTPEMIVGMLGILKAGCGYVPLNPKEPQSRLKYILEQSSVRFLLTASHLMDKNHWFDNCIYIDEVTRYPDMAITGTKTRILPDHLAYAIFTSGTTGKPKGVPIKHANLSPLLHWGYRHLGIGSSDRVVQNLSYYFDWSVWEIFITLTTGACLYMISDEVLLNPEESIDFIDKSKITVLHATPTQYRYYVSVGRKLETLKYLFIGAEKLTLELVRRSLASVKETCRVFNMYGPTEATIIAAVLEIRRGEEENFVHLSSVPIGIPVGNTRLFVLDKHLRLCPVNVVGELYIGGEGVSAGYLNQPELTAEKFILAHSSWLIADRREKKASSSGELPMSYELSAMSCLYKTGDLARWLPNGNIEFLGRTDDQVKIRGFRIELGEIEKRLLEHPGIKEAVMLIKENETAEKNLCAYFVAKKEFSATEIRQFLSKRLPNYMIPAYCRQIEAIPLTANGKLDRNALPEPGVTIDEEYEAPGNEIEKKLAAIWSEVLGIQENTVGINVDFFQAGGHSLRATTLVSRIRKEFNVVVPLVEVFKNPTIKLLSEYINRAAVQVIASRDEYLILLKPGTRSDKHLFLVHDGTGEVEGYIEFCERLPNRVNYWGLGAEKVHNLAPRNCTIEELSRKYIEKIKKVQSHGPYLIAGWSLGGTIAFEMVLELEKRGETAAFLGLIDSPGPGADTAERANEFKKESELDWLWQHLPDNEIKKKVKKAADINEIWWIIENHLQENHFSVETIRRFIPGHLTQIIPNYYQLGTRELIYHLNTNRTLTSARARYIPTGRINSVLYYFKASESPVIFKECWNDYCSCPIRSYDITGNHFLILKKPAVEQTANTFGFILHEMAYK